MALKRDLKKSNEESFQREVEFRAEFEVEDEQLPRAIAHLVDKFDALFAAKFEALEHKAQEFESRFLHNPVIEGRIADGRPIQSNRNGKKNGNGPPRSQRDQDQ